MLEASFESFNTQLEQPLPPTDDEWGELDLEQSQVATTPASACHIGNPECESCQ